MWHKDLSVWRLPTDEPKLTDFLSQVEGRTEDLGYTPLRGEGLLIVARSQAAEKGNDLLVVRRSHVLEKEYFQHFSSAGAKVVDNRDAMHRRGWTYFTVEGQINGKEVEGTGRIPFVYAVSQRHWPWMKLRIGERTIVDDSFAGFSRPWLGLHTVDTVRRDAAEQQAWFETKYAPKQQKAQVILTCGQGKLVYSVDMEKDVIDEIKISTTEGKEGELRFSYLQEIDQAGGEFTEPRIRRSYGSKRKVYPGMLWLMKMIIDD